MRIHRWPMVVVGLLWGVIGSAVLTAGAGLLWAQLTQRDAAGFYASPQYRVSTAGHAAVLDEVDFDLGPPWTTPLDSPAAARVTAVPPDGRPTFVGIARRADVAAYLDGVSRDEVVDISGNRIELGFVTGARAPAPPGEQDFWVASSGGTGPQEVTWPVQDGQWAVVVMNVDGAPGLDLRASAGGRSEYLRLVALGLLAGGLFALLGGVAVARAGRAGAPAPDLRHPLSIAASRGPTPGPWLWTVKWLLLVPHVLALTVLWAGFVLATLVAVASILVTGRYPRALFDFNTGVLRWTWRVGHYSYLMLGTDRYPPFTLRAVDHPATLQLAYPERLSRGLALVKWLLAVPHLLVIGILVGTTAGAAAAPSVPQLTGGLIGLLVLVVGGYLLLVRRYPRGLFDLLMGLNRWLFRVIVYLAFMTDAYPPFRLDQGGPDHGPGVGADVATPALVSSGAR